MNIQVYYDRGRVDEFDTDHLTMPQPFDGNNMLTNYEVRFDNLDTESLWLQAHFYDIRPEYRRVENTDETPVARRMRGWRFLLVDQSELKHVVKIMVNKEMAAWRQGGCLINGIKFNAAAMECYSDELSTSINKKAIAVHDYLGNAMDATSEDKLCALFGFTRTAFEQVREAECRQGVVPAKQVEVKEEPDENENWLADLRDEASVPDYDDEE